MKQVLIRGGEPIIDEVPAPQLTPGTVRVQVVRSCISAGTEGASLGATAQSPLKRALTDPARLKRGLEMVVEQGWRQTLTAARGTIGAGNPTGYSVAGVVVDTGDGVKDLRKGARVACAGAGYASHAEIVVVPRNLVVPIPGDLSFDIAATATLGAIALHGVRRLEPTLGETFVVVGLGLLGQLAAQLLVANGCRVIGTDLSTDRVNLALSLGMQESLEPGEGAEAAVHRLTAGVGADGVVITAASKSDALLSQAFKMCRPKGRVVIVGDVGLGIQRADIYRKELEFRISTSYGPGRYDSRYEEQGLDYPIGYVRWTENRNMQEYLRLSAEGKIRIAPLVHATFPLDDVKTAYESAASAPAAPIVLLAYPQPATRPAEDRRVWLSSRLSGSDRVRIGIIGAGSFTRGVHLPNLQKMSDVFEIRAVGNRTGVSAKRVADRYGAAYATSEPREILEDADIDAVLIGTRHDRHAELVLASLQAGKHVLVEKPLCLTEEELVRIEAFYESFGDNAPLLLTGFNRRFSPFVSSLRAALASRRSPLMAEYRMNAGYIPLEHWVHSAEGGGRNIGEACHIYDLFLALVDADPVDVDALSIDPTDGYYARNDNFSARIRFSDGSICTLLYTALGSKELGKERMELYSEGSSAVLDDYRELQVYGGLGESLQLKSADKGHAEELRAFGAAVRDGGPWPIPLRQQAQAMRIAFSVEQCLTGSGRSPASES